MSSFLFVAFIAAAATGTLAEWLRRGPAKAVCYACVSSNLTGVGLFWCRSFFTLGDHSISPQAF